MEDWARRLHEQLRGQGIDFELVTNVRLHVRRVVVQGLDKAVEVNIERGLNVFIDARAHRDLLCELRQVKATEVQILEHSGVWVDHTLRVPTGRAPGDPTVDSPTSASREQRRAEAASRLAGLTSPARGLVMARRYRT